MRVHANALPAVPPAIISRPEILSGSCAEDVKRVSCLLSSERKCVAHAVKYLSIHP